MNILITGGAGFIGQHLTRSLLRNNVSITILDNFLPQVHGDVADPAALQLALQSVPHHTSASWPTMEFAS